MTIHRAGGTQKMRGATGPQKPTTGAMPEGSAAAGAPAAERDAFKATGNMDRYVVRPGDSLARIAAHFKLPLAQLVALNPHLTEGKARSKDGRSIFPGEVVTLRAPAEAAKPAPKPPASAPAKAEDADDEPLISPQAQEKIEQMATKGLEDNSLLASAQSASAGALRGASLLTKGNRYLDLGADLIEGATTVSHHVRDLRIGTAIALSRTPLPEKAVVTIATFVGRAGGALGGVLKGLGKAAPVLGLVAASYDTYKAVKAGPGAPKRAAIANAALSVVGTTAGLVALGVAGSAAAVPLALGAAAVSGFQLVDTLAFGGKGTQWLGDKAAAAGKGLTNFFGFGAKPAPKARPLKSK